MNDRPTTRFRLIIGLLGLGFLAGVVVASVAQRAGQPKSLTAALQLLRPTPVGADFSQLVNVWDRLHRDYVDRNIDDRKLLDGALAGLVSGLGDPYSTYMNASSAKKFADDIAGSFEGVGMQIGYKNDKLSVIAPLPDTPAAKAGLLPGDVLLTIDGVDVSTLSLDDALNKIRGPKGTTVTLTYHRGNEPQSRSVVLTRQTISVNSVESRIIERDGQRFAYLLLTNFTIESGREFRAQAKSLSGQNIDGIILDLRNNPGGYLDQAVDVASVFIASGDIVSEVNRNGNRQTFTATGDAFWSQQRVIVLVNGGSASASEIVAGALQDTGRAKLVGTQTFGKGSVQDYQTLDNGASLKLTIAKWLTPKGRTIAEQGITPDIVVEDAAPDATTTADPPLDRALSELTTKT